MVVFENCVREIFLCGQSWGLFYKHNLTKGGLFVISGVAVTREALQRKL
jgi:hypothetical protein